MQTTAAETGRGRVWDLPLRLFHWSLAVLVGTCLYTGITGGFKEMDYHMLSGYGVLALIGFRIAWGFIGSREARFSTFVRPSAVIPYGRSLLGEGYRPAHGHNPLGGLSVLAFLLVLMVQGGTGLFANDDIFLEGPLAHLVSDTTSDRLTSVHHFNSKVLYLLLALHLAAVAFHEVRHGERLVLAMITGTRAGAPVSATRPLREAMLATATIAVTGGLVYYLVNHL